ncbi:hypothetical protein CaldiYA01_14360 [Caldicellulosiruptor diazotrophicus]|uniref:Uncharacterized protein n=1 Tax=Caldicellulosiruptor diazotrophicus TaxID=2806205 RepID=A0ABM7NMY9_9FIRM|nr:hypothetical protein CaldiYA01_14360 [Caldicellulosiruptor diazotrophicus]
MRYLFCENENFTVNALSNIPIIKYEAINTKIHVSKFEILTASGISPKQIKPSISPDVNPIKESFIFSPFKGKTKPARAPTNDPAIPQKKAKRLKTKKFISNKVTLKLNNFI